jgi:macrolide-specific efflux system membrane fusion protein
VTLQQTGTVLPEHKLTVTPPIAGRVDSVEVDDGEMVKQGQVLAWISSTERAALIDAARSAGGKEYDYWKDIYKAAPLLAPLDGRIISTEVVPGQVVVAAQASFVMSDRLIVEANVDETDLYQIKNDQAVDITLDGFPEAALKGKVHKIAYDSVTVNNVTTYKVEVYLDETPEYVRSGLTANVFFLLADVKNVMKVPADALASADTLWVAKEEGGTPELRKIETGLSNGRFVEVRSGLQEGEWVAKQKFSLKAAKSGFSFSPQFKRPAGTGSGSTIRGTGMP